MLLVEAAASVWKVEAGQCQARDGQVLGPDGQALGYGKLVDLAATYPLPETVELKQPEALAESTEERAAAKYEADCRVTSGTPWPAEPDA